MKNYRKRKNLLNTILIVVISLAVLVGGLSLINHFTSSKEDEEGYVVVNPSYAIGGINDEGKYEKTKLTVYTKELIKADSIKIELDFDNNIEYQLFFYDEKGNFVSATETLTENYDEYLPEGATHFKVMITPLWDNDVEAEDKELNIFQVRKYTKQLTIKVLQEEVNEEITETEE